MILKWSLRNKDVEWVYLAQGRDGWQAFVDKLMNLRFP
jgi:hypothetical protein